MQTSARHQEIRNVEETMKQMKLLEEKSEQDSELVASCDANISRWQQEIKELQSKMEAEEKRKAEIQDVTLGSLQTQLEEKAKEAIQHLDNTTILEADIEEIVATETLINTRMKDAKIVFD